MLLTHEKLLSKERFAKGKSLEKVLRTQHPYFGWNANHLLVAPHRFRSVLDCS